MNWGLRNSPEKELVYTNDPNLSQFRNTSRCNFSLSFPRTHRLWDITVISLAELVTPMEKHQGHQWTSNTTRLCTWSHQPTSPPVRTLLSDFFKTMQSNKYNYYLILNLAEQSLANKPINFIFNSPFLLVLLFPMTSLLLPAIKYPLPTSFFLCI